MTSKLIFEQLQSYAETVHGICCDNRNVRFVSLAKSVLKFIIISICLIRSLKKFIFRYQYLVEIYSVSAEKIISDAFSYSENV